MSLKEKSQQAEGDLYDVVDAEDYDDYEDGEA
jgi:hypothetical protein